MKFICEKRKEFLKEMTDNLLLTDDEFDTYNLRIELLDEILNKIKEQSKDQNDIIIA
jgi:translation elongation factor P/translation initiation factor 5A